MVYVNGYKVKASAASKLGAIFAKYGDISANCQFKSASARVSLLGFVCDLVQRLQSNAITHIITELKVIENEVSDAEAAKLEVSWPREHLAKIHVVEEVGQRSSLHKNAKANSILVIKAATKELEQRQVELVAAQEGVKEAEKCVNAMKLVSQKIDDTILESEAEEYFWRR
ncbi:uncharacterized protein LOC132285123 isoform X2 [Cornus florida]|nr:uncharacterized protein LOC132285123 isoform X2 [Cornus florida]